MQNPLISIPATAKQAAEVPKRQGPVFVSYVQDHEPDRRWVEDVLIKFLRANQIEVLEPSLIGMSKLTYAEQALETSRHVIIVLTEQYVKSDWGRFEQEVVHELDPASRRRLLIPIRRANVLLPVNLLRLHCADFTAPEPSLKVWQTLLYALQPLEQAEVPFIPPPILPRPTLLDYCKQHKRWLRSGLSLVLILGCLLGFGPRMFEAIRFNLLLKSVKPMPPTGLNVVIANFGDPTFSLGTTLEDVLSRQFGTSGDVQLNTQQVDQLQNGQQAQAVLHAAKAQIVVWGKEQVADKSYMISFAVFDPTEGSEIVAQFDPILENPSPSERLAELQWRTESIGLFAYGFHHFRQGNFEQAETLFKNALAWEPPNTTLQATKALMNDTFAFYIGRSLAAQGDYQGARTMFEQALVYNPNYAWAQLGIGTGYYDQALSDPGNAKHWLMQSLAAYSATLTLLNNGKAQGSSPSYAFLKLKSHYNQGRAYIELARLYPENQTGWHENLKKGLEAYYMAHEDASANPLTPKHYVAATEYGLGVAYETNGQAMLAHNLYAACANRSDIDLNLSALCKDRLVQISPQQVQGSTNR